MLIKTFMDTKISEGVEYIVKFQIIKIDLSIIVMSLVPVKHKKIQCVLLYKVSGPFVETSCVFQCIKNIINAEMWA